MAFTETRFPLGRFRERSQWFMISKHGAHIEIDYVVMTHTSSCSLPCFWFEFKLDLWRQTQQSLVSQRPKSCQWFPAARAVCSSHRSAPDSDCCFKLKKNDKHLTHDDNAELYFESYKYVLDRSHEVETYRHAHKCTSFCQMYTFNYGFIVYPLALWF